jgi:hypothetical protein
MEKGHRRRCLLRAFQGAFFTSLRGGPAISFPWRAAAAARRSTSGEEGGGSP